MSNFSSEQIYIVTGASSGIGAQVALLLNSYGASVVAIARNIDKLQYVQSLATDKSRFYLEQRDLSKNIDMLPEFINELKNKYGKFSGMAYCAGTSIIAPINSLNLESADVTFNVNYLAPLFMVKGLINKKNNCGQGTSIVAISSVARKVCEKGQTLYSGSKAALVASLKCIAREVSVRGIRINSLSPGLIETPMLQIGPDDYINLMKTKYPNGFGKPENIAEMVAFLLSDCASWITGQDYILDNAVF